MNDFVFLHYNERILKRNAERGWDGGITNPIDLAYIFNLGQDDILESWMDEPVLDEPATDVFDRSPDRELAATIEVDVRGHLVKSGRHIVPIVSLKADTTRDNGKENEKELKTYQSRRK